MEKDERDFLRVLHATAKKDVFLAVFTFLSLAAGMVFILFPVLLIEALASGVQRAYTWLRKP